MFLPFAQRREIAIISALSPFGRAAHPALESSESLGSGERDVRQREILALERDGQIEVAGIGMGNAPRSAPPGVGVSHSARKRATAARSTQ
jgi:hypothetical protein